MQYQINELGQGVCSSINLCVLLDWHQKAVVDNVAYFSDLVTRRLMSDDSHVGDIYDQLDSLYLENMSPDDKKALISAYMQINAVIDASHSMVEKTRQIESIHLKIDNVITKVVANFDAVSQQRLQFLSEHL